MIPIMDTNEAIKGLTKKKFTREKAEAIVDLVGTAHENLATKDDVVNLRKDMEFGFREARKDMEMMETRMDKKFAEMQTSFVSQSFKSTALIIGSMGLLFVALQFFGK